MQGPDENMLDVSNKIAAFHCCWRKIYHTCCEVLSASLSCL